MPKWGIFQYQALSKATFLEAEMKYIKRPTPSVDEKFSNVLKLVSAIRSMMGSLSPLKIAKIWIRSVEDIDLEILKSMLNMDKIFVDNIAEKGKLAPCFCQCIFFSKENYSSHEMVEFCFEMVQTAGSDRPNFEQILKKQEKELSRCLMQLESFTSPHSTSTSDSTHLRDKFTFLVKELGEKIKHTKKNIRLL